MDAEEAALGDKAHCSLQSSSITAAYSIFFFNFLFILLACKFLHVGLRRLGQPRIISEFIIGMIIGNVEFITASLEEHVIETLRNIDYISMPLYMFVLGLEMDPATIFKPPGREATIAYVGIVTTSLSALFLYLSGHINVAAEHSPRFVAALALSLSNTASPILTRLTTELKIGKTEMGRIAVGAGITNDMVTTFLMCVGVAMQGTKVAADGAVGDGVFLVFCIGLQVWLGFKVGKWVVGWVNERNPEGKPMKGSHVVGVVVVVALLFLIAHEAGYDMNMNAFLLGLVLPREGRVSNFLISKINFTLSSFILPFYLAMIGIDTRLDAWSEGSSGASWWKLVVVGGVGAVGKVSGTVVSGVQYGLQWPEAVALGLLLNIKGYYHIFCARAALHSRMINKNTFLVMLFMIMCTIIYIPLVVAVIMRRVRRRAHQRHMALQWHDPSSELRMVVGLHGPQNVPTAINIIEATRGGGEWPIVIYAMDMIEMTDRAAATLVHGQGLEAVTVTDESIVEMREQISEALEAYAGESGEGVTIKRLLAISSFSNMHLDICNGAEDTSSVLIIVPFHKAQRVDGEMDLGHHGFRQVNQKVLRHAPCSVGILVDRGLGGTNQISASFASKLVAVIFIGGPDDREALAFAARMANHPGINLTAIRFLPDASAQTAASSSAPGRRVLTSISNQEVEMRADDQFFAGFYEQNIAHGGVGYVEKYVANGAETVATLRTLEGLYNLFVVGRGGSRNSVLTAGMSEWAECPELGPIGDILAASDFSVSASVLIIQQLDQKKELQLIDDEFGPM